jgi:HTH-type transcriptional regulator/antitoxin HigA
MDLKPIRTKRDYQAAFKHAEQLWRAAAGSTEADALDVLTLLIADYEARHFPIADPDPTRFLEYVMESRGLTRKDLELYIGSRARVAEGLNRNRALTLEMIRRLSEGLGLPVDVLEQRYALRHAAWELAAPRLPHFAVP